MFSFIVLLVFLLFPQLSVEVEATPIFFSDRASFELAVSDLSVENFAEPFSSAPSLVFPEVTITESSADPWLLRWISGTDGNGGVFYISDGSSTITFLFNSPINSFGIHIVDFGTVISSGTFTYMDNSGATSPHLIASAPLLPGNTLFFGTINPQSQFTSVTLTSTTTDESIFLDQLSFGTANVVPEPSTLLLFSSGLAGLAWRHRRRQGSR